MIRRSTLGLAALGLLILLAGCRSEDNTIPVAEEEDRIVATASLGTSDSQLVLTWFPVECERFERVEVEFEERFVNVEIIVTVDIANCPQAGRSETVINLDEPVGDRRIWDRAFNDTVALTPAE